MAHVQSTRTTAAEPHTALARAHRHGSLGREHQLPEMPLAQDHAHQHTEVTAGRPVPRRLHGEHLRQRLGPAATTHGATRPAPTQEHTMHQHQEAPWEPRHQAHSAHQLPGRTLHRRRQPTRQHLEWAGKAAGAPTLRPRQQPELLHLQRAATREDITVHQLRQRLQRHLRLAARGTRTMIERVASDGLRSDYSWRFGKHFELSL